MIQTKTGEILYPLAATLHITRDGKEETHLVGIVPIDGNGKLLMSKEPVESQQPAFDIDSESPYFNEACKYAGII